MTDRPPNSWEPDPRHVGEHWQNMFRDPRRDGQPPGQAVMLELRRYEPRSGLWQGWVMPYHSLYAVEYVGDHMLSLDFGSRQFVIKGTKLERVGRLVQFGMVSSIIE